MILLALVPPLWRRVMDPRVADHYDGDLTRANCTPRMRRRLEVTSPTPAPVTGQERDADRGGADLTSAHAWRCPVCSYTYDEAEGDQREGLAAGTAWACVPDTWCCPDCGVREKVDFVPVIAGPAS